MALGNQPVWVHFLAIPILWIYMVMSFLSCCCPLFGLTTTMYYDMIYSVYGNISAYITYDYISFGFVHFILIWLNPTMDTENQWLVMYPLRMAHFHIHVRWLIYVFDLAY